MADLLARAMASQATELAVEVDAKVDALPNGLVYKGSVATISDLPATAQIGDCYTVESEHNIEYAWGKKSGVNQWIPLGADLANVAYSGAYNDLTGKPSIPSKTSDLTNDSGFLTEHQDISGKQDTLIAGQNITIAADGKTISATGGPATYIKSAAVSNNTLTLTKQDNSTVSFSPLGDIYGPDIHAYIDGDGHQVMETIYGGRQEVGEYEEVYTSDVNTPGSARGLSHVVEFTDAALWNDCPRNEQVVVKVYVNGATEPSFDYWAWAEINGGGGLTIMESTSEPERMIIETESSGSTIFAIWDDNAHEKVNLPSDWTSVKFEIGQQPVTIIPIDGAYIPVDGTTITFNQQGQLTLALQNANGQNF